jgi:hypothetical protein
MIFSSAYHQHCSVNECKYTSNYWIEYQLRRRICKDLWKDFCFVRPLKSELGLYFRGLWWLNYGIELVQYYSIDYLSVWYTVKWWWYNNTKLHEKLINIITKSLVIEFKCLILLIAKSWASSVHITTCFFIIYSNNIILPRASSQSGSTSVCTVNWFCLNVTLYI